MPDLSDGLIGAVDAQVGCGLAHMHSVGVAHRDVKPENVVYENRSRSVVRLVDFGFAVVLRDGRRCKTVCGSPAYMAPEIVNNKPYAGPPVDVWALGGLLYELMHNKVAFRGDSMAQLHTRIRKGAHNPFAPSVSGRAKAAIKRALVVDAVERPSAHAVTRSLADGYRLRDKLPAFTCDD